MMQLAKRNLRSATVHFFMALCLVPGRLSAQSTQTAPESPFSDRTEGDFIIKDFHFNDGEVLPELRLHYVTLGTPHRNSSGPTDNAVLRLHSTGGDTTEFFDSDFSGPLYGAGEPLDLAKFYLIIPDSIGHGKSSKPSDGLRHAFPTMAMRTWSLCSINSLPKNSGYHLRLILGLSMGGMHTWLWGERYPEMMDANRFLSALFPSRQVGGIDSGGT